jgi:hypothetical protein
MKPKLKSAHMGLRRYDRVFIDAAINHVESSFPRQRESSGVRRTTLDSRLRGNDVI